ncbi:hypothetical protein ZIOFF_035338 [Zingiber officinale]|uniref:Uncharacterized protein n=1 Tax=Zingiber officinale TaxID=94328 RepID=A0A8J5L0M6_ZINOF|nr:hypothetical protein ZIOFF_035338 [Zingiber officinale]
MNFRNTKVPNVPGAGAAGTLVKVALIDGTVVYAGLNSLYNIEGGHRAIVFNRIQGVKDKLMYLFFGLISKVHFFLLGASCVDK